MSTMRVKNKDGTWDKVPVLGSYQAVLAANEAATTAQNAAKEVNEIYGDGNFTPLSDLLGGLGTKLKRWGTIFANKVFASNLPIVYNSLAEMKADTMLWEGMSTKTLGYYAPHDGGGASYLIRAKADADVDDGGSIHELQNGLVAKLIVENGTVCPEQFGAKGDGITNDSIAFTNAIKSKLPIFCDSTKNYFFTESIDCDDVNTIIIDGNNAKFTNFYLRLNLVLKDGKYTWKYPYNAPVSIIKNMNFRGRQTNKPIVFSGTPIKFLNIVARGIGTLQARCGDYMDYTNIENATFLESSENEYTICSWDGISEWNGQGLVEGDEAYFLNVHYAENTLPPYPIRSNGNNIVFEKCLNFGVNGYTGEITCRDCYFEKFRLQGSSEDSNFGVRFTFENCVFTHYINFDLVDNVPMLFDRCIFKTASSFDFSGIPFTLVKYMKDCFLHTSYNTNSALSASRIKTLDINTSILNFNGRLNDNAVSVVSDVLEEANVNSKMDVGDYEYRFYPSVSGNSIRGVVFENATAFVTIHSKGITWIKLNNSINDCYIHVYRKSPSGLWHKSIIPFNHNNILIDNGVCISCMKWEETTEPSIVTPENGYALMNNILAVGASNVNVDDIIRGNRTSGQVSVNRWI